MSVAGPIVAAAPVGIAATLDGAGGSIGFAAGVGVAAFFSPCAYALLPGYVGYYASRTGAVERPVIGAVVRGGAAVAGAVLAFAAIATAAVLAGDVLRRTLPFLEVGVGIALVALGVVTLAGIDLGTHVRLPRRRTSIAGFGAFGAMYALAAAGCVSPLVIAVAVRSLSSSPAAAFASFGALAGTFAVLLLVTTVLIALGRDAGVKRLSGLSRWVSRVAGAVLVVAGTVQIGLVL